MAKTSGGLRDNRTASRVPYKRNIYYPKMTKSRLERLLSKIKLTDNDKDDLLDFKYLLSNEKRNAAEKGLMYELIVDGRRKVYIPKNKYWITNIETITKDFKTKYNVKI